MSLLNDRGRRLMKDSQGVRGEEIGMTKRERLTTVLRGGKADQVPFTCYDWLIPATDAGRRLREEGLIPISSVGLFESKCLDVTVEREETAVDGQRRIHSRIKTPVGELTEVAGFEPGYGSRWILEHFIKSPDDYRVMQYVYDHTTIEPAWDGWVEADRAMGEQGIVLGYIDPIPAQVLLVDTMGTEAWSEGVVLYPDEFAELHDSLARIYRRQADIAADSPSEVIWLPDNVTGLIMSPRYYEAYCIPVYDYACRVLHQTGKLCFAHYDGANKPLADLIARTDLDIIEAFTPPPMEQMTVAEARATWPDKVLSLNFPGNLFREPGDVIRRWTREYLEQGGDDGCFIIGCTEDFDVAAFDRAFSAIGNEIGRSRV